MKQACENCAKRSAPGVETESLQIVTDDKGKRFSADIGEVSSKGINGHKYFLIVDNGGEWTRVFPLKSSPGRQIAYAVGRAFVGMNVKTLRTDNARNLKSQDVEKLLKELEIEHIF